MNSALSQVVTVLTAIIGVAILAVLVSRKAKTADLIDSVSGGMAKMLNAATSPL